jgi:hypothetical protein
MIYIPQLVPVMNSVIERAINTASGRNLGDTMEVAVSIT